MKLYKIQYLNLGEALLFSRNRLFVWKFENFDYIELPKSLIFFAEILHTGHCLQKGVRDFFNFA